MPMELHLFIILLAKQYQYVFDLVSVLELASLMTIIKGNKGFYLDLQSNT